jgi:protein-L-isoaspartate(D-aspartate) O-methyltransferase
MNNMRRTGIGMTSQRTRGRLIERLREDGIRDEVVLAAMNSVPRHIFVDEALASRAYDDVALPLGFGQTISQPYTVARMTEIMRNGSQPGRVLEIGTGYQAAVLAHVAKEVYSVERVKPLYQRAVANLKELQLRNVRLFHEDGGMGLAEFAPFDGIIMAASATHVAPALLEQLAIGGRMVLPVGSYEQHLHLIEREAKGYRETRLDGVRFVPLLSGKE